MNSANEAVKHRILIVDDHPVLRQGMAQLINQTPDLSVCGEAANISDALTRAESTEPELAVVDISLKGESGLDLIPRLSQTVPGLPILILSIYDETYYASRALQAGARGYLTKQDAIDKIFVAIRELLAGNVYLSDRMKKLLDREDDR